jgi:hypothetical protein
MRRKAFGLAVLINQDDSGTGFALIEVGKGELEIRLKMTDAIYISR